MESGTPGSGVLGAGGHHGDPRRGHRFWVYPLHRRVCTPRWDTHDRASDFCNNCVEVERHSNGIIGYMCRGHGPKPMDVDRCCATMVSMGFAADVARRALLFCDCSVERALDVAVQLGEHAPLRSLPRERRSSEEMLEWWTTAPGTLPEYRRAVDSIAVSDDLMRTSPQSALLDTLRRAATSAALLPFDRIALNAVRAAWELPTDAAARGHWADVAGVGRGHILEGCHAFHAAARGERPLLIGAALDALSTRALLDAAGGASRFRLQLLLVYIRRGVDECPARRRWVFDQLVAAYGELGSAARAATRDSAAACTVVRPGAATSDSATEPHASAASPQRESIDPCARAIEALRALLHEFIDATKERAVDRVFTTPTTLCLEQQHASMAAGDVDVHGGSAYRALLLSVLGVRTRRTPLMHDELKGPCCTLATISPAPYVCARPSRCSGRSHRARTYVSPSLHALPFLFPQALRPFSVPAATLHRASFQPSGARKTLARVSPRCVDRAALRGGWTQTPSYLTPRAPPLSWLTTPSTRCDLLRRSVPRWRSTWKRGLRASHVIASAKRSLRTSSRTT